MSAVLLQAQGLRAAYGASQVLFGIDFEIRAGEVMGLLGRNGMGKTTLIRSLLGIKSPQAGSVRFEGAEITGHSSDRIARMGLAVVPEGRQVFPNLSVDEHLTAFAARRNGAAQPWTPESVYALFPRLAERKKNMGNQLSGGEQQMLAIGRALLTQPALLVLDEATEGLAPLIRKEIWSTLLQLKGSDLSVLIVDRDLKSLSELADTFHVLEKGKIVHQGVGADLVTEKNRIEKFLSL
jgi:branched-chain amino acid transport system ATP-binding protein